MEKEFNLSKPRKMDFQEERFVYREEDVKEFIKRDGELIEELERQLIIDFKTPLSEKSAKRFIKGRIKSMKEDRKKNAGKDLI